MRKRTVVQKDSISNSEHSDFNFHSHWSESGEPDAVSKTMGALAYTEDFAIRAVSPTLLGTFRF